jgi:hypothetical protein
LCQETVWATEATVAYKHSAQEQVNGEPQAAAWT